MYIANLLVTLFTYAYPSYGLVCELQKVPMWFVLFGISWYAIQRKVLF